MFNRKQPSSTTQQTNSICDDLIFLIKKEDVSGFYEYLKNLPIGTEFEIKPRLISFNIYKVNDKDIEIHTTINGWMMTTTTFKLATLFFFGKVDSTFFTWI